MARKGQSLPLNTIVIAIIVIVVMVVIIAIYSGSMGTWLQNLGKAQELKTCGEQKGSWKEGTECYSSEELIPNSAIQPLDVTNHPGQICCKTKGI